MRVALALFSSVAGLAQSDDLAGRSHEARELMAAGRFADAIPIYEQLCRALPTNPGLRLNLALAYHMAGRHAESVPQFETVLRADPNNLPALMSLGVALLELNQPAKAVAPLRKAVELQPGEIEIRGMLANALLSLDRPREAAPHFRKLTEAAPRDPKAWYGLGRSYESLAQQAFRELDKNAQGSAEWLALIADSRMERRQYRSAFYFYREALAKKSDLPGLHAALAEVYRRTEHPDWAAAEQRKQAAAPKPDCAREKAACDFAAGRFLEAASSPSPYWRARAYNELALRAFSELGSTPESVELHALKADMLASHGEHLEAVAEWRAARNLAPDDPRIARQLATETYLARDYEKALAMIQPLSRAEPNAADLHYFIGDSLLHLEKLDEAAPELEKAVQLDPKLLPARASLGLTYARLGKAREAIPQLQAALSIDDDGSLHYQLARAYQGSGDAASAKDAMQKYQEFQRKNEENKQDLEQKAKITAP